jgi:hypothetical protein
MDTTTVRQTTGRSSSRFAAGQTWRAVPRELALVASGILLYFGVRGLTVTNTSAALRHARDIVALEQHAGLYVESSLQDLVDDSAPLTTLANWIYIWGHWPVIAVTLLWLVLEHPAGYRIARNAMLASGAVGLVVFALYPVAPPRLADLGLLDTVTDYSSAYRVLQPQAFVNQYAALPSLHVGWDLLIGLAIVTCSTHLAVRVVGALLPLLMAFSVVCTANHFLVDVVVGTLLVLVCRAVVMHLARSSTNGGSEPAAYGVPRQRSRPRPHPSR